MASSVAWGPERPPTCYGRARSTGGGSAAALQEGHRDLECYDHQTEEGINDVGSTTECDGFFDIEHDENADCLADHAADVTAGVPQAAFDAHCEAEFPP